MQQIVAASAQEFFDRALDAHPDPLAVDVPVGEQLVRPRCRVNRRLVAVPFDEQLGRAPNVDLRGHRRDSRHPAAWASASEQNQRSPFDVSIRVRS